MQTAATNNNDDFQKMTQTCVYVYEIKEVLITKNKIEKEIIHQDVYIYIYACTNQK